MNTLIPLLAAMCAGVALTCLSLAIFDILELIQLDKDVKAESKHLPIILKIFMPFVPNVIPLVKHHTFDSSRKNAEEQLLMAGYDQAITPDAFLAVRMLITLAGFIVFILFVMGANPLAGVIMLLVLYMYPNVWLRSIIKKRHFAILKALPNVLDLLTLSVEAGKDFITALRDILLRRRMDPLGEELGRTLSEIQLGKQRATALKDLSHRVRQPELTSVLNAIVQADELGVSIGQLLRIQGDQLRNKRFSRAEKLANEAPVKILFPVVIFIFPSVIIILMAPIVMQAFNTMMK